MFAGELRKQKVLFAVLDALALFGAFAMALSMHDPAGAMTARLLNTSAPLIAGGAVAVTVLWILVFHACGLYRMRTGGWNEIVTITKACSLAFLLTLGADFLVHIDVSRITMVAAFALSIPLVATARTMAREGIRQFYAHPKIATPLVVIGFNPLGHHLCRQINEQLNHYEVVGFVDEHAVGRQFDGLPVIGRPDQLSEIASRYPSLEAAIAMPDAPFDLQARIVRQCEESNVRWWMVPWLLRSPGAGIRVEVLGVVPLIGPRGSNLEGLNFAIKRTFDAVASTLLLITLSPILVITAIAVRIFDGSPILFRQERVGIRGKHFEMLKFRTMRVANNDAAHRQYVQKWIRQGEDAATQRNENGKVYKIVADNRITPLGRILRRFSLDELPQILNVVRGEMSLIGPRPALPYETELYKSWHHRRLDVVPGITGLWQVSGRNHLSFDEMVRLDVEYMENWSLATDLRILARTVPILFKGDGV